MNSLILVYICAALCSIVSASVFKHGSIKRYLNKKLEEGADTDYGYEYAPEHNQPNYEDSPVPYHSADLVDNVEELKALIHNFMVTFEVKNKFEPSGQIQIIKKAINNLVLVLVTQSYVHVFKPNLLRNQLASAVNQAGVGQLQSTTTDDQRAAFIGELAAEVKSLPLSIVNDFILEYVAADDDNELILKTSIKREGDNSQEVQKLRNEVAFSKVILEMILQSYMIDFNVQPIDGKLTIISSDGNRSRVFNAPPLDTLTKVKLLETKAAYQYQPESSETVNTL